MRSTRSAFTLIELLVVIAIIAILLAILMPGLQRVREQGRCTACKSNLHNYAMATRLYSDDNRDTFPYSFTWLYKQGGTNCNWHTKASNLETHPELAGVAWPYLKGLGVHLCGSFKNVAKVMGCGRCNNSTPVDPQYGYSMNSYLNGDAWSSVPAQYQLAIRDLKKVSQVSRPSSVFYFSEENSWTIPGLNGAGINDNNLRTVPACTTDSFGTFHKTSPGHLNNGVVNASFVDMHVAEVSAWPAGNTWEYSWPGRRPAPKW
jgi:prepilin-type N-terminal cleavage/methylation domain-containing protein